MTAELIAHMRVTSRPSAHPASGTWTGTGRAPSGDARGSLLGASPVRCLVTPVWRKIPQTGYVMRDIAGAKIGLDVRASSTATEDSSRGRIDLRLQDRRGRVARPGGFDPR